MKVREAKLAILDSNVFADLASRDATRQRVTTKRLEALHKDGLLTALTGSVLAEIAATGNPRHRKTLIDTVVSRVDVYLPFQAGDLVRIELAETDPASTIGNQTLQPARGLQALDVVNDPDILAFVRDGGFQHELLRPLLPRLDPAIRKLTKLPTFADHVKRSELKHVRAFLKIANAGKQLGNVDIRRGALTSLLARGKTTRMFILMTLANHYRRAKQWVEKKQMTKPGGALSDTRIIGEAAYAQVLLTTDPEFVACGELVNEVVAEPRIRRWEL